MYGKGRYGMKFRMLMIFFIFSGMYAADICTAQQPEGDPSVVPPGAELELLFDGAYFTEGPAVAPDGKVYFSDITTANKTGMQPGHIWVYDPETGRTKIFRSPSGQSNGIKFDAQGRMLCAEGADFGGRRGNPYRHGDR